MKRDPPNRFRDLPIEDLYTACQKRAGTLMDPQPGPRTPQQRADLALDTGHLLLAVAFVILHSKHDKGGAEHEVLGRPSNLVSAFTAAHQVELRNARHRTLCRAASAALGKDWEGWLSSRRIDGISSEEAFQEALRALQAEAQARIVKP
ncbi:hypothetical protein [Arenimonas oryziterrae]|uniref:Uncharacterized protein n=1 Tax=Arenimonas oryziterrae DSM 21050 = YC6267 TaxID=1121015 RepID=A0A091ATM9_9GAMM|nr:hypothetical protein [Arenimonas oryziterrae]KFN42359.1 hypothetical protein N789_14315 [Arenimonas oryziterrae DSM 21050 = YC6267]